jgi:hypothetical protein
LPVPAASASSNAGFQRVQSEKVISGRTKEMSASGPLASLSKGEENSGADTAASMEDDESIEAPEGEDTRTPTEIEEEERKRKRQERVIKQRQDQARIGSSKWRASCASVRSSE